MRCTRGKTGGREVGGEREKHPKVYCATHGEQQQTLVCQHIVDGLCDKVRVGFFWTAQSPDNPRPDACCSQCQERVSKAGGEWVGEAAEHAKPQTLCGACYDLAKSFHMGGNPWN